MEKLNNYICEGYSQLNNEDVKGACSIWLKAWNELKNIVKKQEVTSIEDIDKSFQGFERLTNWCQDLEMELENAGIEELEFFNLRIEYCKEFYNLLPNSDDFIIMSMKLAEAESYFEIGKNQESEQLFEGVSEQYRDSVWPYIKWGDVYWLSNILRTRKELINLHKARKVYEKALGKDSEDEYIIEERLQELKQHII